MIAKSKEELIENANFAVNVIKNNSEDLDLELAIHKTEAVILYGRTIFKELELCVGGATIKSSLDTFLSI